MNQEKFGKFIKELRQKHNLTQKEFADKYHVTYQAVSKWENGKNMPDSSLIKQISEDFNISLEELYNGEFKPDKKNKKIILITLLIILTLSLFIIALNFFKTDDFKFKTLSANCPNFTISGNIAYNDKKSAIYISNIEYCGGDEHEKYETIDCTLYEKNNNTENKISSYKYKDKKSITLEEFLKEVTFTIDDYATTCKDYQDNSLFLKVNASNEKHKTVTYEIPLKLDEKCKQNLN